MPLTTGRSWSGLAPAARELDIGDGPLTDAQAAVVLGWLNWNTQSLIASDIDPIRHYIAGILVEAALRDPPVEVWVFLLVKQLQRVAPDGRDHPIRTDTVTHHVNALVASGDASSRIDDRRRRVVSATPKLIERAKRRAALKLRMMRAAVLAVDYLDEHGSAPVIGGPLDQFAGGERTLGAELADGPEAYERAMASAVADSG